MIKTVAAYDFAQAFDTERQRTYSVIDALEARLGYALPRERYEPAARVLACPVKANPPNWQHGRVLYAVARKYLADVGAAGPFVLLDIGTAKGYSALCLQLALTDAAVPGQVHSVDVIDPTVRAVRNTVAEVDGLKTLAETLAPWPESQAIHFHHMTGLQWLASYETRVHVAFVDGKHTGPVVLAEGELLAVRQQRGDVVVFDDLQIDGITEAVQKLSRFYAVERIDVKPGRAYAVGYRR